MKIEFCIQFYGSVGGAENQLVKLIPYLNKYDIDIGLTYQSKNKIIKSKVLLLIYLIKIIFKVMFCSRKNTIFYFLGGGIDKVLFYILLIFKPRLKYIVKLTGTFDDKLQELYDRWLTSRIDKRILFAFLRNADYCIVQDRKSIDVMISKYNFNSNRIVVIHNGVEIPKIKFKDGITQIKKILFAGRILKEKGIFELLHVAKLTENKYEFYICGTGPDLLLLKETLIQNEINNVFLLGHKKNMDAVYQKADLFLLPSYREGLPNVVLEAMSYGIPVVATRVGSLDEYFVDNRHIFYLKNINDETIVKKINDLNNNMDLVNSVRKNAFELIKNDFSLEQTANKHNELFQVLINKDRW